MNMTDPSHALLVLTLRPNLEDEVIDWLLANPEISGFTSVPAFGHGGAHHLLSTAEQVAGKQARTQLQVQLPLPALGGVLTELTARFGTSVHSWAIPLLTGNGN